MWTWVHYQNSNKGHTRTGPQTNGGRGSGSCFCFYGLLDLWVSLTCRKHDTRCMMGRRWLAVLWTSSAGKVSFCCSCGRSFDPWNYLNMERVFFDSLFEQDGAPNAAETPQGWFEEHDQILVQPSICGMFWTNQSNQWRCHGTTSKDCFYPGTRYCRRPSCHELFSPRVDKLTARETAMKGKWALFK